MAESPSPATVDVDISQAGELHTQEQNIQDLQIVAPEQGAISTLQNGDQSSGAASATSEDIEVVVATGRAQYAGRAPNALQPWRILALDKSSPD